MNSIIIAIKTNIADLVNVNIKLIQSKIHNKVKNTICFFSFALFNK